MESKDDGFCQLRLLISRARFDTYDKRERALDLVDGLASKYFFYKDVVLNGRDSDDARGCRPRENDELEFIHIGLEEGLYT